MSRQIVLVRFLAGAGDAGRMPAALTDAITRCGFHRQDLVVHRPLDSAQCLGYIFPAPHRRSIMDEDYRRLREALASGLPTASAARLLALMEIEGASASATPSHHYVVETDVVAAAEADLNAWYDQEHLPGLAAVPGTVRAARYRNLDSGPRYHACAPKQRGWMQREQHRDAILALEPLAALLHHRHGPAHHRAGRDRAQRDDRRRPDRGNFALQPVQAGHRFALPRGLVHAPLAAHLELEVLHRVGDVEPVAAPAEFLQGAVEHPARRPDEGPPLEILAIARLLADQHQLRPRRAFPPHRLGGGLTERTFPAAGSGLAQRLQARLGLASGDRLSCPA